MKKFFLLIYLGMILVALLGCFPENNILKLETISEVKTGEQILNLEEIYNKNDVNDYGDYPFYLFDEINIKFSAEFSFYKVDTLEFLLKHDYYIDAKEVKFSYYVIDYNGNELKEIFINDYVIKLSKQNLIEHQEDGKTKNYYVSYQFASIYHEYLEHLEGQGIRIKLDQEIKASFFALKIIFRDREVKE